MTGSQKQFTKPDIVARVGDMHHSDCLCMCKQPDGDIVIGIVSEEKGLVDVEFCNIALGGGKSPRVLKALENLFDAMLEDNEEFPSKQKEMS